VDDGGQTRFGEDDVGGAAGSVGGTLDSDTDIGAGKRRGVVGSVTYLLSACRPPTT
jgi:hypothetical protein